MGGIGQFAIVPTLNDIKGTNSNMGTPRGPLDMEYSQAPITCCHVGNIWCRKSTYTRNFLSAHKDNMYPSVDFQQPILSYKTKWPFEHEV